jgi:F-type H+-transporting ATPase subunit epsilon
MNLQLITLLGVKLDQEVYELLIPTAAGEIGVFPGHEPLVTLAIPGAITVRYHKNDPNDKQDYFAISGGIVEISQKSVRILVDEADHGDDIVESESRAALERAIHLRDTAKNQLELEKAHELVDRHTVRLKVSGLRRRRHHS